MRILLLTMLLLSCTTLERTNPLDPKNKTTHGSFEARVLLLTGNRVTLEWPLFDTLFGFKHYRIEKREEGESVKEIKTTQNNRVILDIEEDIIYTVKVHVVTEQNESLISSELEVSTKQDTDPPSVSLILPLNNQTFAEKKIRMVANAEDNIGVVRVEFYRDGILVGIDVEASTGWEMESLDSALLTGGEHLLKAIAYDKNGLKRESAPLSIQVEQTTPLPDEIPPDLSWVSPSNNSGIKGTVLLKVRASDNSGIKQIEWRDGATLLHTATEPPFQYLWDTIGVRTGVHRLEVSAIDWEGNRGGSSINVEVLAP